MNFFTIFVLPICFAFEDKEELILRINDRQILGRYMTSESGRTISAFVGIPFASPSVGELRFKAPQKAIPWNGTRLTQTEAPKCPQVDTFSGPSIFEGDEDCLYLNVYVPEKSTTEPMDVLVWIHGGAFILGHAGSSSYGPDYLLDNDVILLAGNYRLGLLGFLSTEDKHSTGNFGLKDQAFLLQWVQENIEHFGGNKNSVTIWGESAGAVSVHYQMISPMSRGLFHKAILNSGTLNNAWSDPPRVGVARQQAFDLAEYVNCSTQDRTNADIVECLRGISVQDIVGFVSSAPYPVVEDFEADENAFIGERNFDDLLSNSVDFPVIFGMNSEEGLLMTASFVSNTLVLDSLISNWHERLPNSFGYGHLSISEQEEITKKINTFYFGSETTPTNQLDRNNLINLFTDGSFIGVVDQHFLQKSISQLFTDGSFIGVVETIKNRLSYSNHQSTYVYLYTQKATSSFSTATEFFGTSHADDLISLFPVRKAAFHSAIPTEQDNELTKVMSRLWTNFVRTGNPTPNDSATPVWPLATTFPLNYMQIGNENGKFDNLILQPRVDFYSSRANFWMELRSEHRISSWLASNSSTSCRYSLSLVGFLLMCWYFISDA